MRQNEGVCFANGQDKYAVAPLHTMVANVDEVVSGKLVC